MIKSFKFQKSGLGTKSDDKQKQVEAFTLVKSMKPEAYHLYVVSSSQELNDYYE